MIEEELAALQYKIFIYPQIFVCVEIKHRTHVFQAEFCSIPFFRKKSLLTMTGKEWDAADTCLVCGTPASCVANSLLQSSERRVKSARGDWSSWTDSSAGCSPTYQGEKSGIDLFCGNVKLALNRKISLKPPKMPFAAIVDFFQNIFLNNSFP